MKDLEIISIYVFCDEILKCINHKDNSQSTMSSAEIMTFSIIASRSFGGNHRIAQYWCLKANYFPNMLSQSQLNRRLHKIPFYIWLLTFRFLALVFLKANSSKEFAVDSFPISSCEKMRIDRRKLFKKEEFIGYAPSKRKYFCGVKVHMLVTGEGKPIEFSIQPASKNDLSILWKMELNLPQGSVVYADGAYNSYLLEDLLAEDSGITLLAKRKQKNSKRQRSEEKEKQISSKRQIIETAFSTIVRYLPKSMRPRTEKGFLLRVLSALLAYSFYCLG